MILIGVFISLSIAMRRIHIYLLALITLTLLINGCAKEVEQQPLEQEKENIHAVVFHAGWAPETKTVLREDGNVWWSPGDEIRLCFPLKEKNPRQAPCIQLVFKTDDNAPVADYYLDMDNPINRDNYYEYCSKRDQGLVADTVYAIYPQRSDARNRIVFTNEGDLDVQFTIPTVQIATPESFDKLAMVSIAESNGNNLSFRNLCGGIKFSVSQSGIKEVSFRSIRGKSFSGSFAFRRKSGELFADWPSKWGGSGSDEVIVRAPENTYFEVGKYYYAVVNPLEDDSPIIVTYKKDSSKASYFTSGPTSIKRSVFKRLYDKDSGLTFRPFKDEAFLVQLLPDYNLVNEVTEAHFHPSSDYVTDVNLGSDDGPIYFELVGTAVHYYTPKESFNLRYINKRMFSGWSSLAEVDLTGVDVSEVTDFSYFFAETALKSIDLSNFDTSSAVHMNRMFHGCKNLESLDLTSFNTEHVTDMSAMFEFCRNLRDLDLSSFNTSHSTDMSWMFNYCVSLEKLDLKSFNAFPDNYSNYMCHNFAIHRKHCIVRASEGTRELMCGESARMPEPSKQYFVRWISPEDDFPEIVDPFADMYKSTDYSKDKTFRTIQTASKGKGIDIVIMGDAYSDRLIENGKYDSDLSNAIEHIFSEDPLNSLRDYFNVYICYAVSENESITGITALDLVFEDWPSTAISGGDGCDDYMKSVLPDYGSEWVNGKPIPYIIIVANCTSHSGTHYFFSSGASLTLSALGENDTDYHFIVCHEFGHAIGRLADEYYQRNDTFENNDIFTEECANGFWPNIDVTSDPNSVKWSRFLQDGRYANQGLGVFEGGFADYAYGIWRPTENSIMNNAPSGFNAPCREAIYKRVNELADDSFVYDYETFVAFDRPSWENNTSTTNSVARMNHGRTMRPLPPPVFIKGTKNPNGASTTIHN